MTYQEQLKRPEWQKKRLEVMERSNFECVICGSKEDQLHIHHPFYRRGAMIWQYSTDELQCLCHKCHKEAHAIDEKLKYALSGLDIGLKMRALGYIDSMQSPFLDNESSSYLEGFADGIQCERDLPDTNKIIAEHKALWCSK